MKQNLLLFCLIFLISCSQNAQTQNKKSQTGEKQNYATELIDSGFLKYADRSMVDSLKTHIVDSFNVYEKENYKITHIDAEELAEFSFDFFLPNLNKILAKRYIELSVQKLNENQNSFEISINGETLQLYTKNELKNETFWDKATRNFFKKINEILKAKKCDEQFYLLYGGNDLHSLLLTDRQFSIISNYYHDNNKEKPYKP